MGSAGDDSEKLTRLTWQIADLQAEVKRLASRVQALEGRDIATIESVDEEEPILLTPIVDSPMPQRREPSRPIPPKQPQRDRPQVAGLKSTQENWESPWKVGDGEPLFSTPSFDLAALEKLIGGRWLTWLGGLLLILAVAFFVPWAWNNFKLPDWLRVLIFHLCGACIVGLGVWLRRRADLVTVAHGVIGVGLFTLYAAAFTMRYHYVLGGEALSPTLTFLDCCAITLVAVGLAVRFDNFGIVLLGALGGYLTPIIAHQGQMDVPLLLSYLAFLNVALLASASFRQWTFMKPLVLVATSLMFLMAMVQVRDPRAIRWQFELFAAFHGLILLSATTLPAVVRRKPAEMLDLRTMAATSMAFMGITWFLFNDSPNQQLGLVALGLAALHFFLGRTLAAQEVHRERLYRVHLVMAIAFLTLSVPLQLHKNAGIWAVTWGIEALAFTAMGVWFRDLQLVVAGLCIFSVALVRLFGFDYFVSRLAGRPEALWGFDRRLVLSAVVGTTMLLAGGSFWWVGREKSPPARSLFGFPIAGALLIVGHLVILCGLIAQWQNATGCMIVIANALALFLLGFRINRYEVRYYAAALLMGIALPWMVGLVGDKIDAGPQPWGERFALFAFWSATAIGAGLLYRQRRLRAGKDVELTMEHTAGQEFGLENILGALGLLALLAAFTLELRDYMQVAPHLTRYDRMVELASYSILWSVYASLAVIAGLVLKYRCYRAFGLAVLLLVLLKVFFVDLARLALMPRIAALAVLGFVMMGVSYLYQRFVSRMEQD